MNIAVTEGVVLMPTPFSEGLDVWSRGDGLPGSDSYQNLATAAFVPADADFAGCLEIQKTETVQKLRYMGETPIFPGVYLRVTARIKALAGSLPNVRIGAWAGDGNGNALPGVTLSGATATLSSYGEVVEVSAIVGVGSRRGVDMPWGPGAHHGHFGIDLFGPNGGVVRVEDIVIEDVTEVFIRDLVNVVDVRDYGAVGDGVADESAAFEAADAAAAGRTVFVSAGTYRVSNSVTFENHVVFEGTLTMPSAAILSLTKDFDLPTYVDAFGGDEEEALRKALQSLLNGADHESLDLGGRRVSLDAPVDVHAAVSNRDTFSQRRVLRNGQLRAEDSGQWAPLSVNSNATYATSNAGKLTNVANVANIAVGSLVEGAGVGREIYVTAKNNATQEVTLSDNLHDAEGTQNYTFTRFRYLLDFSGFTKLEKFEIEDVEFQCQEMSSGLMLPKEGTVNVVRNCVFNRPAARGITSIGTGCQGLVLESNQFISAEGGALTQNRVTIAFNTNANDVKVRNNRASQFRHFAVIGGQHSTIMGNHFFQGDDAAAGVRSAGIVLAYKACNTTISNNYIDNCHIEWTNERETDPDHTGGFGFSGMTVTGNVFLCSHVAAWFSFLVVKPYGANNIVNGLNVSGNLFRCVGTTINRVERVDTSFAPLNLGAMKNVHFTGNNYNNVAYGTENPLLVRFSQNSHADTWQIETDSKLPFSGHARYVTSVVLTSRPRDADNVTKFVTPYFSTEEGSGKDRVHAIWPEPMRGDLAVTVRMDS